MVPRSNMPKYAFLADTPLDTSLTVRKMKALKFPYRQADLDKLKGKTEMDAMIAYLQKIGNDIPWREAAQVAVVGELKNPYQDNLAVLPEAKKLFEENCAQCHGKNLQGQVGPSLWDVDKPDALVFKTIYGGVPAAGMPAFGETLGRERIWKLVTFIKTHHRR